MQWWLCFILAIDLIRQIRGNVAMNHNRTQAGNSTPTSKHLVLCGGNDGCVPFVSCPAHVRMTTKKYCEIIGGLKGICCRSGYNHTDIFNSNDLLDQIINLDLPVLDALAIKTRREMADLRSKEDQYIVARESKSLCPGSADYSRSKNLSTFNHAADLTKVARMAVSALEIVTATRVFKNSEGMSNSQLELGMMQQDLSNTALGRNCLLKPDCPKAPEKYRRIDGTCNNENNPSWGSALSPYSRLLPPSYADGVWSPRLSVVKGKELPSARLIRAAVITDEDVENKDRSYLVMQFGQFVSHDITQSVDITYDNGSLISCCNQDNSTALPIDNRHYACMPIEIPVDDYFYAVYQQRCMNFVRTALALRSDCTLGYAQQMNTNTHFIDGSGIYGSSPEQTDDLRSFEKGRLKVFHNFGSDLLPLTDDPDACPKLKQGSTCFKSGDTRTNQIITLTVLHTVFMREHNRVAGILADLNPKRNDEQIFLEARRIVGAELQVIIYKEFLPAVLGELAMEKFKLNLLRNYDYSFDYDAKIEPSIINEFASAVYRFGHSMVGSLLKLRDPKKTEMLFVPDILFNPARLRGRAFIDKALTTLTTTPIQEVDNSVTDGLTDYLFSAGHPFGVDLASLNIQRGRDHGVRPYNDYRELVGLPRYTSFEQFGPQVVHKLKELYASVDDVDLWVGGLLEEKAPGSILGPTFQNVIAEQFSRLKRGDKYFFERHSSINPGHFEPDQLMQLRKASMSRIICDNSDGILLTRQAPNAFRTPGVPGNEFADCKGDEIPRVNLTYWKE